MREVQQLEDKVKQLEQEIKGLKEAQALINKGITELGNYIYSNKSKSTNNLATPEVMDKRKEWAAKQ